MSVRPSSGPARVLTIAGSAGGGGAGSQTDFKPCIKSAYMHVGDYGGDNLEHHGDWWNRQPLRCSTIGTSAR